MTLAPSILTEVYLLVVLSGIFFLPGSALLIVSGSWRRWPGVQQFIVAIGLSLAFFPILFYASRFLLPSASLGPYVIGSLLLLAAVVTGWGWWKWRVFVPRPTMLEWIALIVLGLTFLSRFWFAHTHPFPAWSDSLHHTLLTQLTADYGRLPTTLEPYFPNVLEMYHLGLYSLSGTAAMLTQAPAHTALLWTAQYLNGLCGVGIYLVLDRYVGRKGAVVGLAVAGLFSMHPALWVNWGRFTQLSGLVVLPIAWALMLEALWPNTKISVKTGTETRSDWLLVFAALTTSAIFFFHFRVAVFYALLLLPTAAISLWQAPLAQQRRAMVKTLGVISALALLPTLPTLWDAASVYISRQSASSTVAQREAVVRNFYLFPLSTIPYLAAPVWLLVVGGLAGLLGVLRRNIIAIVILIWVILLALLGNAYLLEVPWLNITNFGAILIMLYLPIAFLTGAGAEEGLRFVPRQYRKEFAAILVVSILAASLPAARARATYIEPERHFMTEADAEAMQWINENVPRNGTFAINTYRWLPNFYHGTDAGYWIPYLTGRNIVTSAMLSDGLPAKDHQRIIAGSAAAEALETDLTALDTLYDLGVEYIYIGARGDFAGEGLRVDFLIQSDRVELLYEKEGVAILRIIETDN